MRLLCLLEHLRGQSVQVAGEAYRVSEIGHLVVTNPSHAATLLANTEAWMVEPEPLMPVGPGGEPEHVVIPEQYLKQAPHQDLQGPADAYADPALVAHIPAEQTVSEPVTGIDFAGHVVTEADDIRAKEVAEAPRPTQVSAPLQPASATLSKTQAKKGRR